MKMGSQFTFPKSHKYFINKYYKIVNFNAAAADNNRNQGGQVAPSKEQQEIIDEIRKKLRYPYTYCFK